MALDDLAAAVSAPSSVLATTRQAPAAARHQLPDHRGLRPAPQPPVSTVVPGWTEHALRKLQIHDPALLLRAAVIDQAAHDLVAEATAKARSRDTATRPAPGTQHAPGLPARVTSQDAPLHPRTGQAVNQPLSPTTATAPISRNRTASPSSRGTRAA
jgi:hypothetical protein